MKAFVVCIGLTFLLSAVANAQPVRSSDISQIDIVWGWTSLGSSHDGKLQIRRETNGFRADGAPVSDQSINDLLRAIWEPALPEPTLENLGMDSVWLEEHALPKNGDYTGLSSGLRTATPEQLAEYAKAFTDIPALNKRVAVIYATSTSDYASYFSTTITLRDDSRIVIESLSDRPGMLPWNITGAGLEKRTYDVRISRALDALAHPNSMIGVDPRGGVLLRLSVMVFANIRNTEH